MPALKRAQATAEDAQSLFVEWIALTEAAVTAVEMRDAPGLADALAGRDALRPRIERVVGELVASRGSRPPHADAEAAQRLLAERLPLDRIVADLRDGEARLMDRLETGRQELQREMDQLEQAEAVTSAYQQIEGVQTKTLNLLR